jgi:hypothetical protein
LAQILTTKLPKGYLSKMVNRKQKNLPSGFKEGVYGINKTSTFGVDVVTLQMESELDDVEFYNSYAGHFDQLESEWRGMREKIAVLCQRKLRTIGQKKRVVKSDDLKLAVLALVHTDEEDVYFRISFRVLSDYSGDEADLLSENSLLELTGPLDWSKLDLNIVNFD